MSGWGCPDSSGRVFIKQGVWDGDRLLGYLTWPAWSPDGGVNAKIAIDESAANSLNATRVLLRFFLNQVPAQQASKVKLEYPQQQVYVREVASSLGFRSTPISSSLSKLVLGKVVTESNWTTCKNELLSAGNLRLPENPPVFRDVDQKIELFTPDGNKVFISIDALETLLSPALFCLPGRNAAITPIKRSFSEPLLGHSPQMSFLPMARAALYQEKHYLSSPKTLSMFTQGTAILFYETLKDRGSGAIVAVARVKHAYLKTQEMLEASDLDPSVLDSSGLEAIGQSKIKTVTVFDNLFPFPNPVQLSILQAIGCGSPTDLITTHRINDQQLQRILSEGMKRD